MKINISKNANLSTLPKSDELGFGQFFTDHMFVMDYSDDALWHNPRIIPYQPLTLEPSSCVFHYGAEVFEGLKAYRREDGKVQLFRPWENVKRLNNSAERLGLPTVNESDMLEAMKTLVELDERWVPSAPGTSLYIRPFMIGTDPQLGLHGIHSAKLIIILSPVGSYYKEGLSPVSIMIETEDVRAVKGGTGYAKCGGNYAASNRAGDRAVKKGYTQVLWLDGVHRKYIEEVGAMNVMFKINGKIITPELTGSILPGITRSSCIHMLKDWGFEVEERLLSVEELMKAAEDGSLEEAWGTGTAAVVSPIGSLCYDDKIHIINNNSIGPVTKKLYDNLTSIQWGKCEDPYGWTCVLESKAM